MSLKNIFSLFLLALCCVVASAHAEEEMSIDERIHFLEDQRGYKFKKKGYHGVAQGEFLFWKADVDGVAYGVTESVGNQLSAHTPHFSYDPGFRIGLGAQAPYDLIDFSLEWTRFNTSGHDKTDLSEDTVLLPIIGLIKSFDASPSSASAVCHIRSNVIDAKLARGIIISRFFFLRPFFGIRAARLELNWDIRFHRDFVLPSPFDQESAQLKVRNKFQGIGGLVGVDTDWRLWRHFGFSANGAGALVYGPTSERTGQKDVFVAAGTMAAIKENFKAKNSFRAVKAIWEIYAGLFWQINFYGKPSKDGILIEKRRIHEGSFRLYAGYEYQQWPLVGQKTNVQNTRERERFPLNFHGFVAGAKLVF